MDMNNKIYIELIKIFILYYCLNFLKEFEKERKKNEFIKCIN